VLDTPEAISARRERLLALGTVRPDLTDATAQTATLATLNQARGELNTTMGLEFTGVGPGTLVATMPVAGNRQPFGLLHGGASCVLAETLGSVAASLNAPAGKIPVGIDINATHHRAAVAGLVTGVCTPLYEGRTTASYAIEITAETGRRVCTSRLTCQYIDPR
jgi:uncharacterized protein (TIGR00369 family)